MMKKLLIPILLILLSFTVEAQYEEDRHSTNYYDAWISCEMTPAPNEKWGDRHWIMYEFDDVYVLGEITLWNYNDRENTGIGVRDVIIDYSEDGETWAEWGLFSFDKAPVSSFYRGTVGPDLEGLHAKYLLFTVLSNHGGGPCAGIGELKIETEGYVPNAIQQVNIKMELGVHPNPVMNSCTISLNLEDLSLVSFILIDQLGRRVKSWEEKPRNLTFDSKLDVSGYPVGQYYLYVRQHNGVASQSLTIVK